MNHSDLTHMGYSLDESTNVWQRPNYAGIPYSDGDHIEEEIEAVIKATADVSLFSDALRQQHDTWAKTYHLSPTRANILRPFEAQLSGARVLEIGAGCGAITRYLGEVGAQVLSLEGSPRRARICRDRARDLDNVTVLTERFQDFETSERFDVITLIGVLEYASRFTTSDHPTRDMLRQVAKLLKPDGILIIAIENQLGLKYFAGALEDHIGQPMYGLENRYTDDQAHTFGRLELQGILKSAGYSGFELFTPFPDYKLPSVIITEQGFRNPGFSTSELIAGTESQDLQSPELPVFSQYATWPSVIKNGLGQDLANSFLIAATFDPAFAKEQVLGYHFSTQRVKSRCKIITFKQAADASINVESSYLGNAEPDTTDLPRETIESTAYLQATTQLSAPLFNILTSSNSTLQDLVAFFAHYRNTVAELANLPGDELQALPPQFIDAIPQNILIDQQGKPNLIDVEWTATFPLSFDFLLFRAMVYSHNACRLVRLKGEEGETSWLGFFQAVYKALGLAHDEGRFDGFAAQEETFQKGLNPDARFEFWPKAKHQPIRKPDIYISHASLRSAMDEAGRINNDLVDHQARLEERIKGLENHVSNLEQVVKATHASTSWKLTAPLRKLLGGK